MKSGIFSLLFLFLLSYLPAALTTPIPVVPTVAPAAGHTGIHHDETTNIVHVHYGSHDMPEHMEHVLENQAKYPQNKEPFHVGRPGSKGNRKKAMEGVQIQPGKARDEKPPNFVVHDGTTLTVKHLSKKESDREMKLLGKASHAARKHKAQVQFHANPAPGYASSHASTSHQRGRSPTRSPSRSSRSRSPSRGSSHSKSRSSSGSPAPKVGGKRRSSRSPSRSPSPQRKPGSPRRTRAQKKHKKA